MQLTGHGPEHRAYTATAGSRDSETPSSLSRHQEGFVRRAAGRARAALASPGAKSQAVEPSAVSGDFARFSTADNVSTVMVRDERAGRS
jgi:hypothetical protein